MWIYIYIYIYIYINNITKPKDIYICEILRMTEYEDTGRWWRGSQILLYMCPDSIHVSFYYYICVLILLCMCAQVKALEARMKEAAGDLGEKLKEREAELKKVQEETPTHLHAHVCSRLLTNAHVCSRIRMLTGERGDGNDEEGVGSTAGRRQVGV